MSCFHVSALENKISVQSESEKNLGKIDRRFSFYFLNIQIERRIEEHAKQI